MKDIFGTNVQYGGSWVLDGGVLTLSSGEDLIVNSVSVNYARPVSKIMPLNTAKQYLIAGRGGGTINLGMIVGPNNAVQKFLTQYTDPCKLSTNTLTINATPKTCVGSSTQQKVAMGFIAYYCLVQSLTASVTAGDIAILGAGMALVIGALEVK